MPRLIDAGIPIDEITRLQIFLAGVSLLTPAIKETVLRTIKAPFKRYVEYACNDME